MTGSAGVDDFKDHEHRLRVRYAETDQMGVVYHAEYLVWMDEARTQLFEDLGLPYADIEKSGFALAVRSCELRYRAPAVFGDIVVIHTRVLRVRGASMAFGYELEREADGKRLATGSVELACTSMGENRRPVEIPEPLRRALETQAPSGGDSR